jgi:hypothetical protein
MILALSFTTSLIVGFCLGSSSFSSSSSSSDLESNRRPDEELVKLDGHDYFDVRTFSSAYYQGLYKFTVEDAVRLERTIASILKLFPGGYQHEQYYMVLREMMGECSVDSFKCLYQHCAFPRDSAWLTTQLLVECAASNENDVADYLIYETGCFEAENFIREIKLIAKSNSDPEACVEAVGLVAASSTEVDARKCEIYTAMLSAFIENQYGQYEDEDFEKLARELVSLGADVSETVVVEIKNVFPELTALHEFLADSIIPDCKQPED